MRRPLAALFALTLVGGAAGCKGRDAGPPPPQTEEEALALAEELLDQGDGVASAALLDEFGLLETPEGAELAIEAAIVRQDFEAAFALIGDAETEERMLLLHDTCAMGALASLDVGELDVARARLAPCGEQPRIDVAAITLRAAPDTATIERHEELTTWLHDLSEADVTGPELDMAATTLEQVAQDKAEQAAEGSADRAYWLVAAFSVAQNGDLNDAVVEALQAAADSEQDPQVRATLYEYLYLPRVEGLTVPEEVSAAARVTARQSLFPVYLENARDRYERKHAERDTAAGVWNGDTGTFTHAVGDDASYEAFLVWLFRVMERSRPFPTPDPLAWAEICTDRSEPCTFPFETYAQWAYHQREIEQAYLTEHGMESFEWDIR